MKGSTKGRRCILGCMQKYCGCCLSYGPKKTMLELSSAVGGFQNDHGDMNDRDEHVVFEQETNMGGFF